MHSGSYNSLKPSGKFLGWTLVWIVPFTEGREKEYLVYFYSDWAYEKRLKALFQSVLKIVPAFFSGLGTFVFRCLGNWNRFQRLLYDFLVWRQNPICFLPSFVLSCSPTIKQYDTNMWADFPNSSHAVAVCWQHLASHFSYNPCNGRRFTQFLPMTTSILIVRDMLLKILAPTSLTKPLNGLEFYQRKNVDKIFFVIRIT